MNYEVNFTPEALVADLSIFYFIKMPIFFKNSFNFCCFVDNEATLSKFANKAYSKFLKNLKEKPECVPEELFSATFGEEKVKRREAD